MIGFADDVNILTYGDSSETNCATLAETHTICQEWARTHGMRFAPEKYALTHFTRQRCYNLEAAVQLEGGVMVTPSPTMRVLGLILDTKLNWKGQLKAQKKKMATQMFSLLRTTASTYGVDLRMARLIYLVVIRTALAYASTIWHQPTSWQAKSKGLVNQLKQFQNQGLRIVLGALKATPIKLLELEAHVPPLELFLNGRTAIFQSKLARTTLKTEIQDACHHIRLRTGQLQVHQRRRTQRVRAPRELRGTPGEEKAKWAREHTGPDFDYWGKGSNEEKIIEDWTKRWSEWRKERTGEAPNEDNLELLRIRTAGRKGKERKKKIEPFPPESEPNKERLRIHTNLQKAESSLLIQLRTNKIGLGQFLYTRKVPGYDTAQCECQRGAETPRHLIVYCRMEESRRGDLRMNNKVDFRTLTGTAEGAKRVVKWVMQSGRLKQFALAKRLLYD